MSIDKQIPAQRSALAPTTPATPIYDALVETSSFDPASLPERTHETFMAQQPQPKAQVSKTRSPRPRKGARR